MALFPTGAWSREQNACLPHISHPASACMQMRANTVRPLPFLRGNQAGHPFAWHTVGRGRTGLLLQALKRIP